MVVFRQRLRWLVLALGMVAYFEANAVQEATGAWVFG